MPYQTFVYDTVLHLEAYKMSARELRAMTSEIKLLARAFVIGPYSKLDGGIETKIAATNPVQVGDRVEAQVHTGNSRYANIVESGARHHEIFPKAKKSWTKAKKAAYGGGIYRFGDQSAPQLKFFWRKAGHIVYTPHVPMAASTIGVSHPGMQGKHFMARALYIVGTRHNFRPAGLPGALF